MENSEKSKKSNVVLKTSLITVASIILALLIVFGSIILFSPKTMAGMLDKAGNYGWSVVLYESAYNKSKSDVDLYDLVIKLDEDKDAEKTNKYGCILINADGYRKVVDDNYKKSFVNTEKADEFIYNKTAISKINLGDFNGSTEVADKFLTFRIYTEMNPYRMIISKLGNNITAEQKSTIKTNLENYRATKSPTGDELTRLNKDIAKVS